ncbi:MAG: glycoside hydrolase family 5 protein [Polyangiaceae bacterium]
MRSKFRSRTLNALCLMAFLSPLGCLRPPTKAAEGTSATPGSTNVMTSLTAAPVPTEKMTEIDAWAAVNAMTPGINIGNTLENTTTWETGWGQPVITKELIQGIASAGFKTVRLPVAWDTYAVDGQIQADKFRRVSEVVDWITGAGMFCVLNIHWDGGWIDSSFKERYPDTYATFSPTAEKKFRSYWQQIATFFGGKNERLVFEGLNEETKFENEGSPKKAYQTLTRVNQLFIDTVRATGGNNEKRLLIVTGYGTDFAKTCDPNYKLPVDKVPHRLFISVHYYTPWPFCGMTEDADWGKMALTWGSPTDVAELESTLLHHEQLLHAQQSTCFRR